MRRHEENRSGFLAMAGGIGIAMACSIASVSHAAEIVDWGGNVVEADQSLVLTSSSSNPAVEHYGGFDTNGDPLKLSPASGYTGADFYGYVRVAGGTGTSQVLVAHDVNGDFIRFKRDFADVDALVLWRQADFGGGLDSGSVAFDSTSTASMNIAKLGGWAPVRMVIRLEGGSQDGYYISEETPFVEGARTANPTALTWLAYDPAADLGGIAGAETNLVIGGRIDHVTEVGFYSYTPSLVANRLDIKTFAVTAVPEPSAMAAMGLAVTGLLARRRRRA